MDSFVRRVKRKVGGFSLIELMVVVAIIGVLASLGVPQYRKFTARARQAEARTTLDHINKLQTAAQMDLDRYAAWNQAAAYGYKGTCTPIGGYAGCTCPTPVGSCTGSELTAVACVGNGGTAQGGMGTLELGLKMSGCAEMRYGYWALRSEVGGKERYLAIAYAPSDEGRRIYPNCSGTTPKAIAHTVSASGLDFTTPQGGGTEGGDVFGVDEEKTQYSPQSDIITECEAL